MRRAAAVRALRLASEFVSVFAGDALYRGCVRALGSQASRAFEHPQPAEVTRTGSAFNPVPILLAPEYATVSVAVTRPGPAGCLPAGGQPAPVRRLARPGRRHRRPRAGAGGHRPHRRRRGRTRPARRAENLDTAAVLPDRRAGRRRRLAEPDLEFRAFCARKGLPASSTRNWSGPGTHGGPSDTSAARPASGRATPTTRSGHADHTPACPRSGNWTPQRCSRLDCYRHPKKASHGPGRRTRTRLARRRRARFAVTVR